MMNTIPKIRLTRAPLITAVFVGFGLWILLQILNRVLWVLVLILLALILAAAMQPIVKQIRRWQLPRSDWRIPRAVAVILIYLGSAFLIAGIVLIIGGTLANEVQRFSASLPFFARDVGLWLDDLEQTTPIPPELIPSPQDIVNQVQAFATQLTDAARLAGRFVENIINFGFQLFIVLTLALFMVVEAERILIFWISLFPPARREQIRELTIRIGAKMARWVLGQITVALIAGILAGISAALLGLPYPILFGVLTAILDLAPVVGVALMTIPAFLLGLTQSLPIAIVSAVIFYAISQVDANILSPLITGRAVQLSPTLVIIALPMGLALYGVLGVLIAIPVVVALQILTQELFLPWLHHQQGIPELELPAQPFEPQAATSSLRVDESPVGIRPET